MMDDARGTPCNIPEYIMLDKKEEEEEEEEPEEEHREKSGVPGYGRFVEAKMEKAGIVFISREINEKLATEVMAKLLAFNEADPSKQITVFVNSPGGSADAGFGVFDVMKFIDNPVRTMCVGLCASAGILVFLGGDKGQRYVLPHSRFMIHQPSAASQGRASDLEITAREIVKIREKAFQLIARETGIELKKIKKDSRRDFWLNAEEALEYGLVDKIVTRNDEW